MEANSGTLAAVLSTFALSVTDFYMIIACALAFVVFWKLSAITLFKPYLKLFELRESATLGAESGSKEQVSKAAKLNLQYDEELGAARLSALKLKASKTGAATKTAAGIVSKAEDEARSFIARERKGIQSSIESMKAEVFKDTEALADDVARLLKEPAQPRT